MDSDGERHDLDQDLNAGESNGGSGEAGRATQKRGSAEDPTLGKARRSKPVERKYCVHPRARYLHPEMLRRFPTDMMMAELRRRLADLQEEIDSIDYGQQVKAIRLRMKMSTQKFAEYIGFSPSAVNAAETGQRAGTAKKILAMLQARK